MCKRVKNNSPSCHVLILTNISVYLLSYIYMFSEWPISIIRQPGSQRVERHRTGLYTISREKARYEERQARTQHFLLVGMSVCVCLPCVCIGMRRKNIRISYIMLEKTHLTLFLIHTDEPRTLLTFFFFFFFFSLVVRVFFPIVIPPRADWLFPMRQSKHHSQKILPSSEILTSFSFLKYHQRWRKEFITPWLF